MTTGLLIFNLLAVLHVISILSQKEPQITLYDEIYCDWGSSFTFQGTYNGTSLVNAGYGWNDRAKRYQLLGTWVLYDFENFNNGHYGAGCRYPKFQKAMSGCEGYDWAFSMMASSLRVAGHPTDVTASAVNLYKQMDMGAEEELLLGDTPVVNLRPTRSLIMTGPSDWTFYNKTDFGGFSLCIKQDPFSLSTALINY